MKTFKLLMITTCLISVFALTTGKANAYLLWIGYSDLCFEGNWKGGNFDKADGQLNIDLLNVVVKVACVNQQASTDTWHTGEGNFGELLYTFPASADPEGKGHISVDGCIDLGRYDNIDDQNFTNICNSSDPNKFPVLDSAIIDHISVEYTLLKCLNEDCTEFQVKERGIQECDWLGYRDSGTGLPISQITGETLGFDCDVDEIFKK